LFGAIFERAMKIEDDVDEELLAIYDLLRDICEELKRRKQDELFEHLFTKINSIPHKLVVTNTVDLLSLFTHADVVAISFFFLSLTLEMFLFCDIF
jgi:hypothetical protein